VTVDSTDAAIANLVDREEVKELRARYCRFLDLHQWDELRSVFTTDARLELAGGTRYDDRDSFVAAMRANFGDGGQVVHHCQLPELVILDPDRIRGVWALFSDVAREGTPRSQSYSYYAEEYRRTPAGWKIAFLRLVRLRTDLPDEGRGVVPAGWLTGGAYLTAFLRGEDG
jgi:hypothetical protein